MRLHAHASPKPKRQSNKDQQNQTAKWRPDTEPEIRSAAAEAAISWLPPNQVNLGRHEAAEMPWDEMYQELPHSSKR